MELVTFLLGSSFLPLKRVVGTMALLLLLVPLIQDTRAMGSQYPGTPSDHQLPISAYMRKLGVMKPYEYPSAKT